MPEPPPSGLFRLTNPCRGPLGRAGFALAAACTERLFGLRRLAAFYEGLPKDGDPAKFPGRVLRGLGVTVSVDHQETAKIPASGPLVVVANHPYGAVEGILLADLLLAVRPDVRVMANFLLKRIPDFGNLFIGVNPFGGRSAALGNLGGIRESLRWVRAGGLLVIFPAGEVSSFGLRKMEVSDPPWSGTLGKILRGCKAPVLPVHFGGRNGLAFQVGGVLHPRLRTALLPREFLKCAGRTIPVRFGAVIPFSRLAGLPSDRERTAYLRLRTYLLARRQDGEAPQGPDPDVSPAGRIQEPLAPSEAREALEVEVSGLPVEQILAENGPNIVFHAEAGQIPTLLREIGRLRELTFRQVGEGTGRPLDIDRFDGHYRHLFIWNRERGELVGAYRLGETDTILARFGPEGLYTSTLFNYQSQFLQRVTPALEVGRSFVRPEYQRSYAPLLLLWKGVGRFVIRNPRYRLLFGPVSISRDYSTLSRDIIASSLQQRFQIPELSRMVEAKAPIHIGTPRIPGCGTAEGWPAGLDLDDLSAMVADIEFDRKGIPVLLRQYLNLGAKLLAFNVDKDFSDVLDGLILVDLMQTDPKILDRYMGREGAASFRAFHDASDASRKAILTYPSVTP